MTTKFTRTSEKEEAIYDYYLERQDHYKQNGLLYDIRLSRVYEEVADKFYLSGDHIRRIISKKLRGVER